MGKKAYNNYSQYVSNKVPTEQTNTIHDYRQYVLDNANKDFTISTNPLVSNEDAHSLRMKYEKEQKKYYENKYIPFISGSSKEVDMLYNNQWLLNIPIIRNIAKDNARGLMTIGQRVVHEPSSNRAQHSREFKSYKGILSNGKNGLPVDFSLVDLYLYGDEFKYKDMLNHSNYSGFNPHNNFLNTYSFKNEDYENINSHLNSVIKRILNYNKDHEQVYISDEYKDKYEKQLIDALSKNSNLDISKFSDEFLYGNEETINERYNDFIKNKNTKSVVLYDDAPYKNYLGLGNYTGSLAYDNSVNLPFISISDTWDFEPSSYSVIYGDRSKNKNDAYIQASLLHNKNIGTPFNIYDRFYFNPETKEYITDEEVDRIFKERNPGITRQQYDQYVQSEKLKENQFNLYSKAINKK